MDEQSFRQSLESLSGAFRGRRKYRDTQLDFLVQDVYRPYLPTDREWEAVLLKLRSECHVLPSQATILAALMEVRRGAGGKSLAGEMCPTCLGEGILWLRRDHSSKACIAAGCGCVNRPAWAPKLHELLEQNRSLKREDFENSHGQRVNESYTAYRVRKEDKCLDIYQRKDWLRKACDRAVGAVNTIPHRETKQVMEGLI